MFERRLERGQVSALMIAFTDGRPPVDADRQLTQSRKPSDGCEFSPDGVWIFFNTEMFSNTPGHAQLARMRADGSDLQQLTFDERVNWFPHVSPDGSMIIYLSYPPGTEGHPPNLPVQLKLVRGEDWHNPELLISTFGGQGPSTSIVGHPTGCASAMWHTRSARTDR